MTGHRQTTGGTAYSTAYTYDLSGALIEETYPSGRKVKNTLDANGVLSLVETMPSGGSYQTRANNFTYNAAGAVTSMQLGNGNWESTQFNPRLQPVQIALGTTQNATDLLKLEYGYGTTANNGNVLSQKITVPGLAHPFEQTYAYDPLNRLASATETYNSTQTWAQVFGYDRYGNRNITSGYGATSLTFNAANNRITTSGFSYDSSGNTTADPSGKTFVYDAENKQTSVANGGMTLGTYFYDGDGKRVKKTASTGDNIIFIYDAAGKLIEERDLSGNLQTSYVYAGSRLLSTETSSDTTYLTIDHLGSPRINTDGGGNVTSRKDFMAFGEEAITAERNVGVGYGIPPVRQDYTGYEKEAESGLEFAQARFQNPVHGRFTSVDPLTASATIKNPQTFNRYTYALNSPYKFTDPLGLLSQYTSGACGNGCKNSDPNNSGGGWIGSTYGMQAEWNVLPPPIHLVESHSDAAVSSPVLEATTNTLDSSLGSGPVTPVAGSLQIFGHEIAGEVSPFGDLVIKLDLNVLTHDEAKQVLQGGVGFTAIVRLDIGNSKNELIPTKFVDSDEVGRPAHTKDDGTRVPVKMITEQRYVQGTSRVTTSASSNVRASGQGEIAFSDKTGLSVTATFRGSFRSEPEPSRSTSFYVSIFSKRSDYASNERSAFTVRISIIPRKE